MAYGIPNVGLPMYSLDKGFTNINDLFNRLREHSLKQQQMVNDAKYRGESLKISKQQQERLGQLLGPQLQDLADKHKYSQPGYKAQQVLETLKMMGVPFAGGQQSGQGDVTNPRANPANGNVPMNPNDQNQMPNDPSTGILNGEHPPMDNGDMTEEELNSPPVEDNASSAPGLNLQDPRIQSALAINGIHIPVPGETAQQKADRSLDLFKKKEQIKAANKTGSEETLTEPIKTKYQNVIGGVTSARPILKKLIEETKKGEIPGQMIGSVFKRDAQANYKGEVSTLLDGVRNAYTIPNTDSGTAKAEDKVLRKNGESDANYAKRLEGILAQMDAREKDARIKLNAGNITAGAAPTVHLIGPNGEDYDVPESEVNAILQENTGVRRG